MGVVEHQENMSATRSGWDREVSVVVQASDGGRRTQEGSVWAQAREDGFRGP